MPLYSHLGAHQSASFLYFLFIVDCYFIIDSLIDLSDSNEELFADCVVPTAN